MDDSRPDYCCGVCPPIVGGGYDCTCRDTPRCPNYVRDYSTRTYWRIQRWATSKGLFSNTVMGRWEQYGTSLSSPEAALEWLEISRSQEVNGKYQAVRVTEQLEDW